ncbi:Ig-like domain-containing protein, partial [Pseudomonas sp. XK-1]|uniref:Ig-like domain-containing protein n=1 Tax=Pseudomonas sp. XK-1 TaxID=3136019 RepID=UPI0031193C63
DGQSYSYTARVEDAAGNRGTESNTYAITLDTTAPTQTVTLTQALDNVDPISGAIAAGGTTNDDTPTLQGTLSATLGTTEQLHVLRNGVDIGVATVSGTDWSYQDAGLASGSTYTYTAQVVDAAGNSSAASNSLSFTVNTSSVSQTVAILQLLDNVDPLQGNVANGGTSNDTTPTLSGSISTALSAGDVVEVLRDGSVIGTASVSATTWTYQDSGLLDGSTYSYTARVVIAGGNQGAQSAAYSLSIDTSAPTQTVAITSYTDDQAAQTGSFASGSSTNDTTPRLNGTLDAGLNSGETVAVYRDGALLGSATVSGSTWSFQDSGLVDGQSYSYTARVVDAAGNLGSPSAAFSLSIDTQAPAQSVTITTLSDDVDPIQGNVADNGISNDTSPLLGGTLTAALGSGESVHLYRDGLAIGTANVSGTSWSFQDNGLAGGNSYAYTARAVDAAGNLGALSSAYTVTVDIAAPTQTVSIVSAIDDVDPLQGSLGSGSTTNDTAPQLTGTLSAGLGNGEVLAVLRDGVQVGTASVTGSAWTYQDAGLSDNRTYSYTTRVVDAAGNLGATSSAFALTVDTSAPTQAVTIVSAVDDVDPVQGTLANGSSTNDATPQLNGTLDTPLGTGESVAIYRDGTLIGTATTTGTNWTFQEGNLTENTYSYTARVVDTAGNLGAASTAFVLTVDTSAPASAPTMVSLHDDVPLVIGEITSGSTTDDTLPTLNGTGAEADSQVNVYDNGTLLGTSTADATGAWSFTPTTALPDGTHAFTVSNVDAAGNEGPQSASIDFIVDTQVPNQVVSIATVTDDMAPITGTVANGGTTNDTSPLLSGTLSSALAASEQVVVLRDGVAIGQATVSASSWTFQESGLADGSSYTYTARVDDAAGNQGALSTGYSLIIDASTPAQTVTITAIVDDIEPVSGTIADGGTTNDSQPELQGTLSAALAANEVVAVYRNGSKIGEATVNATNWTLTDTSGLADNTSYSYTARVEDAAGNLGSLSNTYGITLQVSGSTTTVTISSVTDDTEPQAGLVASGGYSNDTSPLVAGVLSATLDPAEVVDVLRNGVVIGQATVTDTTWSYQDSGLTDGDYTYLARVRDTGTGNLGADSNAYNLIHIDAIAPTQTVILSQAYDNVAPLTGAIADGGTTNDDTPLLGGTLSAVLTGTEQVHVFRNGVDIGVATVSGTAWSYQDTGLVNGSTYIYSARVIDAAGNLGSVSNSLSFAVNTSSVSQTVQILQVQDDVDPVQGNVATGGATNDTTPTLSGSISTALSAGDVVEVLRGGSVIGTASVSGSTWTYQDSGLLNGSSYSYTARVVNAGGNQGAQSTAYTLTVDTTAPTQTVTIANYADNVDPNQGNYASGTTTNDSTPQLNGTLSATLGSGETVAVYRDGTFIGTATVSGTSWSYQDAGLADGNTYAYTGRVVDRAGNLGSESAVLTLSVDTSTPTQSVLIAAVTDNVDPLQGTVTNGGTTNDTSPQLSGTITTALNMGESVAIYRDGVMLGTATTNGTAWTYQDAGLVDGDSYSYTARVIDAAGNVGAQSASYAFTIDTTVPTQTVAINSYQDDTAPNQGSYGSGTITNDLAPQLAGSLSAVLASGEAVAIYRDDVRMGTATVSGTSWVYQDAGLSDASTYTYVARVEDAAGNAGTASAVFTLSVDTTAPSQIVSIVSVIDNVDPGLGTVTHTGSTNDNTPQLNGQLSTTLGAGENVAVYRDGVLVGNATVSDTAWTYQDNGLSNGTTYVYTARVVDAAGNPGELSANYTISVDTTVPTQGVTITAVADNVDPLQGAVASGGTTNDDTPQLSGTLTASLSGGESVVVYRDGSVVGTASVSGTTWTFQDSGLVNGGSYVYTASVVDAASNLGPLSANYVITLDTSAPAQTTAITSATDNVDPLQGSLASGSVTNDTTPQLNGTLSNALGAGESVAIYRDGVQIGTATMTGATTWSYLDSGLANATTYSYTARVVDAAGNLGSASSAFALTVDSAAPTQSVSIAAITDNVDPDQGTVASGGTTNDTSPLLSGGVSAALNSGESVVVYRDGVAIGTATMTSATTWTFQDSALVDGVEYSYSARVVDAAGNLGTSSASYSITLDTSAPTQSASITAITDNVDPLQGTVASGSSSNDTSPLLSGTLSASLLAGETLVVFRNGVEIGSASVSGTSWTFQDSGLADGQSYSYSVRVEDSAGNPGPDSNAYSLLIDTSAPTQVVTISSATDDVAPVTGSLSSGAISNDTAPLLNGALSASLNSGESVAIYRNGALIGAATVSGTTWTFQDNGLSDGASYSYTAQVVDAAGNSGTLSSAFTLTMDSTAPTQTVSISSYTDNVDPSQGVFGSGSTTNDTSPQLTGTLSTALGSGELLVMLRDGVAIGYATVTGTSWSFQDAALLNGTTYAYTARVEDAAGNVGATSSAFSLNVDTVAPTNTATIQSYTDRVGTEQGDYSNGTTTDDRNPVLNGSVSVVLAGGEEVRIYEGTTLLGTATVSGSAWTFTLPALADNTTHTYRAVVADAAGNEGSFSGDFTLTVDLKVQVDAQNTLDTTPVVTGGTGFVIQEGEYLEVTINGVTYSSLTGAVVVDPQNNTWYVQIPTANALPAGTSYDVAAVLKNTVGNVITQDTTVSELYIANPPAAPAVPASSDVDNKATAMTIGEDGQWRIFSNMTILDANGSDITSVVSFSSNTVWGNDGVLGTVTFMDMNRDGYMDVVGEDSRYADGQQAFMYMGDGYTQAMTSTNANGVSVGQTNTSYYAFQIGNEATDPERVDFSGGGTTSAETYTWFGGTALYDKVGDGYVDIVYGDNTPNDEEAGGGYDTSFTLNNGGIFTKDGALTYSAGAGGDETWQATPEKLISTVDLNNDGAVDITYLAGSGSNYITGNATTTGDNNRFVVASNDGTGNLDVTQIVENMLYNDEGTTFDGLSMTWADFDGDGWLDLFQGRTYATTSAAENQSKIFFNDGTGRISATNTDADPIDEGYNRHYNMGDTLAGGGSVAVDWNADGRTDVIEIPYFTNNNPATAQTVLLFSNNTSGGTVNFSQSTLTTVADTGTGSAITGILAMDIDWDGDRDAILFTGTAGATLVQNNVNVADGTSLHLRILDQNGINALFGNTVKLYDSAGNLVATQVLNPQSGNQTSDSSALIDFYGLNANETYTAVMLRNIAGNSQDVGGVANIGGYSIENVNAGWTGLSTGQAYDNYVLTAESGTAVNNANIGNGIVGTGYNDTFFATQGSDIYNGGGGTTLVSDSRVWSNTGGEDMVDYKLAGNTAITVDLSNTSAQNTGFGTATFVNIEGVAGGSAADTFTDNAGDNLFDGRGGNDTFNLTHGGNDTLLYRLLDAFDATGGNGWDQVNGFTVGTVEATADADRIDLSGLLSGYTADEDGAAHYLNGVATMDVGETIQNYLSVTQSSGDTIVSIDRDGSGGDFQSTQLVTLNNVTTDLETLLANHQIVI